MSRLSTLTYDNQSESIDKVMTLIDNFIDDHDIDSLLDGGGFGEWLYQSDRGQIDGLELVANILDALLE